MKALEGIKVVDLTYYVAGPATAKILADWGAEVIKIEPPTQEPGRTTSKTLGMPATDDINPYFSTYNFNKRDLALNLKTEEGKAVMEKLLAEANVFVTSFRPGALKRLGLDYESMSQRHPHIVWGSINGYGDFGPDCNDAGFDTVAFWARSGAMMDMSDASGGPVIPALAFGDATTACSLSGGIAAALYRQARTGKGGQVRCSLLGQAIWNLSSIVGSAQYGDVYPKTRELPNTPMVNSYRTKDQKWIFTSVFDDSQYPKFLKMLGLDDMAEDEQYNNPSAAKARSAEMVKIFDKEFEKYTQDECVALLKGADIAHARINHAADMLKDPQAIENKYIVEVTHPGGEKTMCAMPPAKIDTIDVDMKYGSPLCGEHTMEVLAELGYSDAEIAAMEGSGAVYVRK